MVADATVVTGALVVGAAVVVGATVVVVDEVVGGAVVVTAVDVGPVAGADDGGTGGRTAAGTTVVVVEDDVVVVDDVDGTVASTSDWSPPSSPSANTAMAETSSASPPAISAAIALGWRYHGRRASSPTSPSSVPTIGMTRVGSGSRNPAKPGSFGYTDGLVGSHRSSRSSSPDAGGRSSSPRSYGPRSLIETG